MEVRSILFCIANTKKAGIMEIALRFFQPNTGMSYFLFGPRGTGKSMLVKSLYPEALWIDLLSPDLYLQYQAFPERLKNVVQAHKSKNRTVVIDEVQKVPALLSVVHQLIELKEGWQFILTGSSARKLKQSGVDLLAGRALLKHLHPFMASEIPETFDLKQALNDGLLPLVLHSDQPKEILKTYLALYIKEEVHMEGLVRKLDSFSRFLEAVSFSQASILNYAHIARECHISNKTVENYVQILEDLLLAFQVPVFTKNAQRQLSHHPKFYFFDVGVFKTIRPIGPLDNTASLAGLALETLVAQHLRAWLAYSSLNGALYFWRTKSGLEVDFVIYGEIGFYGIEVKLSATVHPEQLRGLQEFKKEYPESQVCLVYCGEQRMYVKDILCVPVSEFLCALKPDVGFPFL
jgi:predicted AAA+ superfamily ATPase